MRALRKIQSVGENGKLFIDVPKQFGKKVEIIILSVTQDTEGYSDWTDEEWQALSLHSFMNTKDDKETDWEEFFDVENG
jgi:hypothetical protein